METVDDRRPTRHQSNDRPAVCALDCDVIVLAIIAFSTDAMLPPCHNGLTTCPLCDLTKVPLIVTAFILGMGMRALLWTGPLSDCFWTQETSFIWVRRIYIGRCGVAGVDQFNP